jgi:septum site-determining protein MinD
VVDFDVGLRNLDLVLGAERRVVFASSTSCRAWRGFRKRSFATSASKSVAAAGLADPRQGRAHRARRRQRQELRGKFDWVICDSPAGIERGRRWRCVSPTPSS